MLPQIRSVSERMNLEPYFKRIAFRGDPKPDLATLKDLHILHPLAIPFENLSTLLGEPVDLGLDELADKLIEQERGGYCFEQNSLFQHVLETIGFDVLPLAARVVWNQDAGYVNPRTHMALLVEVDGSRFLCDVGFGGATLTAPLAFVPGEVQPTPHEPFRIERIDDGFRVDVLQGDMWRSAYEFDLQPQKAIDYEAMSHFVQTHERSHFRSMLMAARPDASGRFSLGKNVLTRYENGKLLERRQIRSAAGLKGVLAGELRISLPDHPGLDALLARVASENHE